MHPRTTRRARWTRVAASVAVLAALAPLGLRPDAVAAAPVPTTDAALTWKLSEQAWTSTSLAYTAGPPPASPASDVVAPVVRGADGFELSADGATFDPATGAASASFAGSFALGNTNQGGYRIRFASPVNALFRLNLGEAFEVLQVHAARHLAQARRVRERDGFPPA